MGTPESGSREREKDKIRAALERLDASDAQTREELAEAMRALEAAGGSSAEKKEGPIKRWQKGRKEKSAKKEADKEKKREEKQARQERKELEEEAYREDKEREKAKGKKEMTPAEEVAGFISQFGLEPALPPEFANLSDEQKLLVVRQLKNRILDIVKTDAQTQYSEDYKQKGVFGKMRASLNREERTKGFESLALKNLQETEEGKQLIAQNFAQLSAMMQGREVRLEGGKPEIVFLLTENVPEAEKAARVVFNAAANRFREIPYEWGQGKGKNKKAYEKAKKAYDEAKITIVQLEIRKTGPGAMLDMLQVDNVIQMDQLIHTHPEFEAELERLSRGGGLWEQAKDVWNFGGKGKANKLLFAGGFAARGISMGMGLATLVAAPAVGLVVGGWRGRIRGKQTLEERKQQARYGQKGVTWNEKKGEYTESGTSFDAEQLTKKLERSMAQELNEKTFSSLSVRIDYTLEKIEQGQVNFGDAKNSLGNQYKLIEAINEAVVMRGMYQSLVIDNELSARLDLFSAHLSKKLSERQKKFINKQMLIGAGIGAGVAVAGYGVRWVGEQIGLWGQGQVPDRIREATPLQEAPVAPVTGVEIVPPDTIGIQPDTVAAVAPPATPDAAPTPEPTAAEAATAAATPEAVPEALELLPGHEITADFSVKLGEGGVPKNLETVFNEISADHMKLPTDGIIDEQFATKSLNMAANLVRLSEGHGVSGISAEDFAKVAGFKDGILEIKDHDGFNRILSGLQTHSDELWEKGTLQGQGAAITQIPKISQDNWLKILHADGLHEGTALDGTSDTATGILGHQDVTAEHINNFNDSELVKKATEVGENTTIDNTRARVIESMGESKPSVKITEEVMGGTSRSGLKVVSPEDFLADKSSLGIGDSTTIQNPDIFLSAEMLKQVDVVYQNNIVRIFPTDTESVWHVVREGSAEQMLAMKDSEIGKGLSPFVSFLRKLHDITGLNPKTETLIRPTETNAEFIKRALQKVAQMGQLDKVKL